MPASINSFLENLIRFGWFLLILAIVWIYFAWQKRNSDYLKKTIELEKMKTNEKFNSLSDAELLDLTNLSNKSRPGAPGSKE